MLSASISDDSVMEELAQRIAVRLEALLDQPLAFDEFEVERATVRPVCEAADHVCFRFHVITADDARDACVLIPVREATSMAGYLMMLPTQVVCESRLMDWPDTSMREALQEVGAYLVRAIDAGLRGVSYQSVTASGVSCQRVRAGTSPAMITRAGDEFVVGRMQARLFDFDPFEMIVVLPGSRSAESETEVAG